MRLGRWIGAIVALLLVACAIVMLVMMQRQLEKVRDARAAAAGTPQGATHGKKEPPADPTLPAGAMR